VRSGRSLRALAAALLLGLAPATALAGGTPSPDAAPPAAPDAAPPAAPAPPPPPPPAPAPGPSGPSSVPSPDAAVGVPGASGASGPSGPSGASGASGPGSSPLKVTPPLAALHYDFPIVGDVSWGDSYGVPRPDVPSGWHHGDDLFAPLGAPVVAVSDGTISEVGWEKLGGWRLWLTNAAGDSFYYAHLSGYTRLALHATQVRAGEVLGFVGNTGDADGGATHLHFEIHPAALRSLGEDGAVDPTTYLAGWRHLQAVTFGLPVRPDAPSGVTAQADNVFRALLASPSVQGELARRAAVRAQRAREHARQIARAARLRAEREAAQLRARRQAARLRARRDAARLRALRAAPKPPPTPTATVEAYRPASAVAQTPPKSSSTFRLVGGLAGALAGIAFGVLLMHRPSRRTLRRALRF
jgi:murein DD-endopeptidase MepM/ murein hydrolase activator NlpD